ncbi:hypothetical protein MMC15_001061 [Xylographa vitiligo]|nr:hypothetical protein [Xylographa vitiligo]
MGFLTKRIKDIDVQLGLAAITSFVIIGTSAISFIRHYSYRIFYTLHIALSFAILPILYFHVKYLRIYILETAAVYIPLVLQRYTVKQYRGSATVTLVPSTSLIRISLPATTLPRQTTYRPGQHVYLSRPFPNGTSSASFSHMNPFSIANLPLEDSPRIELIARELDGSTKMIAEAARRHEGSSLNFLLEGPYGSATKFPDLLDYDHVLFVAGGVGATFTLPIYRDLLGKTSNNNDSAKGSEISGIEKDAGKTRRRATASHVIRKTTAEVGSQQTDEDSKSVSNSKLSFIWSVRTVEDATWGLDAIQQQNGSIPEGFELFVSGKQKESQSSIPAAAVYGRPQVKSVVEKVFMRSDSQRVAVLVCGPAALGRDIRREVGEWVWKGREVWWHEEQFS